MAADAFGVGEDGGHVDGHPNLVDGQIGIRRDDRAAREIHALAGQVSSEAALLALQPLHKASAPHIFYP